MKRKLDTRFPAPRIKKIMQTDEDIGKIAKAVPLLVSKALELFLQDLCDHTYEITLKRGAKTVNSVHLKQCVQSFNVFDFLKDAVNKVPNLGGSVAASKDRCATKRRKHAEDEEHGNDIETKTIRMHETCHTSSSGRVRGRGRGRGYEKLETIADCSSENKTEHNTRPDKVTGTADLETIGAKDAVKPFRNFDLNVDLNESGEPSTTPALDLKHDDISCWSLDDIKMMATDHVQLVNINNEGIYDEDEDYDKE